MAFLVEDGTGLAAATAYVSVSYADAYHALSGAAWTGEESAKQQAIVKATRFIDRRFFGRFRGVQRSGSQALAFPRVGIYDEAGRLRDEMPRQIKEACAEYALRALSGEILPDPEHDAAGVVRSRTEQVGPISESVEYERTRAAPSYPEADALLRPLLHSGGAVRA